MIYEAKSLQDFLHRELDRRIETNPRYSMRSFARSLKMSPGELSEILRGKRGVSLKSVMKVATSLGLTKSETKYLVGLHHNEQQVSAGWIEEEETNKSPAHQVDEDLFKLISKWYHLAILNLMDLKSFKWDARYISRKIGISPTQATLAMRQLLKMGLVEKVEGKVVASKDYVLSPSGIPSEAIKSYHHEILTKAKEAIDTQAVEEREMVGLGLACKTKDLKAMKEEISSFVDHLYEKYGTKNGEEVYFLETALFRLTKPDAE